MKRFFQNGGGLTDNLPRESSSDNLLRLPQATSLISTGSPISISPTSPIPLSSPSQSFVPMLASQQYFDVQYQSRTTSPVPPMTPNPTFLNTNAYGATQEAATVQGERTFSSSHSIERSDLLKGLRSLESFLAVFDEYRDLKIKLAKCEKRLAKSLQDFSKSKVIEKIPSETLQSSALIFDSMTETASKHAKLIQKEYECVNEHCGRYFKRIAKEEKNHDELLDSLDSKVKKAHANHEKNSKRSGRIAMESHDKYIHTVQLLTQEITQAKANHCSLIGSKTYITSLVIASTLGGIADSEFKANCENIRRSGVHIGKLNEWLNFASSEAMIAIQPVDLDDEALGWAQRLAIREGEMLKEMQKVEEARLSSLEHAQTIWKAQQMGWLPPNQTMTTANVKRNPLPMVPNNALNNLPRLESHGQETQMSDTSKSMPNRVISNPESAKSIKSIYMDEKPRQQAEIIQESKKNVASENVLSQRTRESSFTKGTIVERIVEDISEEVSVSALGSSPSKSSNSFTEDHQSSTKTSISRSSEDDLAIADFEARSRGPTTPVDENPTQPVTIYNVSTEKGTLKESELAEEAKSNRPLFSEKSLNRYVDLGTEMNTTVIKRALETSDSIAERAHQSSMKEREKEQERQVERESQLQRRLLQAEERLRRMDQRAQYNDLPLESPPQRPRYSESTQSYRRGHLEREIPAQRYEAETYTPAMTSIQTEAKVTRNLSTDSERSFVARMKARYQAEKSENYTTSPMRSADVYIDKQRITYTNEPNLSSRKALQESRPMQQNKSPGRQGPIQAPLSDRRCAIASLAPPPNYRRQTMPPVKEDYGSLKAPPASLKEIHLRRSLEEDSSINQERRVMLDIKSHR